MVLEIKNGSLSAEATVLFTDLNFTVRGGELVCLCGAPGSGKSAVAKSFLGLQWLDGGYVSIDGTLITPTSAPAFRRMAAYVPQHLSRLGTLLHPEECSLPEPADYSVFEFQLPPGGRKTATNMPVLTADETLALIRRTLSAGKAKQFVIADEPTIGLSDEQVEQMVTLLRQQTAEGKPVLVVSNDERLAGRADKRVNLK